MIVWVALALVPFGVLDRESADGKKVIELASLVRDRLQKMTDLSFELVVTETVLKPGGEVVPPRIAARATVAMAKNKLHTIAYQGEEQDPGVVINCDGERITEWTEKQWTQYAQPGPEEGRSITLETGFNGCYVGSVQASWLGAESERAQWLFRKISEGRYAGVERLDDKQCDVIDWERTFENFRVSHTFYIDRKRVFVVRWTTSQTDLSDSGETISQVTRQRDYRSISTAKIPPNTFKAKPPAGAVEVDPARGQENRVPASNRTTTQTSNERR